MDADIKVLVENTLKQGKKKLEAGYLVALLVLKQ